MKWVNHKSHVKVWSILEMTRSVPEKASTQILKEFFTSNKEPFVLFEKSAKQKIYQHITKKRTELGGLLVGKVYSMDDSINGIIAIHIIDAIESKLYESTGVSLTMDAGIWQRANERNKQHNDELVVGWYHSHPDLGAFFSGTDRKTQADWFSNNYSLGFVIDPVRQEEKWYRGRESLEIFSDRICHVDNKKLLEGKNESKEKSRWSLLGLNSLAILISKLINFNFSGKKITRETQAADVNDSSITSSSETKIKSVEKNTRSEKTKVNETTGSNETKKESVDENTDLKDTGNKQPANTIDETTEDPQKNKDSDTIGTSDVKEDLSKQDQPRLAESDNKEENRLMTTGATVRVTLLISGKTSEIEFPPNIQARELVDDIMDALSIRHLMKDGWVLVLTDAGHFSQQLRPDDVVGEHVSQLKVPVLELLPALCAG
jgi:proteasome lid subunit RPN8/RPN11